MSTKELFVNGVLKKRLSDCTVDELLELEEAIIGLLRRRIQDRISEEDWKSDFLGISEWSHLPVITLNVDDFSRIPGMKVLRTEDV